ncbi:MAG: hypothetical protein ACI91T_001135 [Natronomonas sp.]|jgi:hypothetical protein
MDEMISLLRGIGVMVLAIYPAVFAGVLIVGEANPPNWAIVVWLISPIVAFLGFVYFADPNLGPNAGPNSPDGPAR